MKFEASHEDLISLSIMFDKFVAAIKDTKHEISICPDFDVHVDQLDDPKTIVNGKEIKVDG